MESFTDELEEARIRLAHSPYIGQPFDSSRDLRSVRRVLLEKTSYHVYYTVEEHEAQESRVTVRAVWHAKRGHGPTLR